MACILALLAAHAQASPRHAVIDPLSPEQRRGFDAAKIETLPSWERHFPIQGRDYRYRILGAQPKSAATTAIPTLIVPIRVNVPDKAVVFDATPIVAHIVSSPLFSPTLAGLSLQFADAMLRAEFPAAPRDWHTLLMPQIGPTLDVTIKGHGVRVIPSASGKVFGFIRDSHAVNSAITRFLRDHPDPQRLTIFITYNSVEDFAYGYHSWAWADHTRRAALIYMYASWLEDVDDALRFPSPDAATLSHEIVETIHDPLLTSRTLRWGNRFEDNRCFTRLIEVADAIEDAPLGIVYARQTAFKDGRPFAYTVQNAALLPWFTRESPSRAAGGAYSFPDPRALHKPAPLDCVPRISP
ncbi:MAG TPA: hypothetical protein VG889_23015 [Rhizomicrobium sp.]|nr:hypothetical protein [Rhizomicrobium sp.]